MHHLFALVGIAIVLFASTNVDDIFVLLSFFADPKFKGRQVAIGQYLGIGTLFTVSVVASLVSLAIPAAYIGLLGFVPIGIGLKKLWDLRKGANEENEEEESHAAGSAGHSNILTVAAVTLANGGDNISVYTPLFATRSGWEIAIIGVVFAVMTLAWLGVAHGITNHPKLSAPIRRYGHRIVPFVLIILGGLILHEAGTLKLFR